jgi:N-acetylmuramoyl-L-alanine amidase
MAEPKNKKFILVLDAGHGGVSPENGKSMTFPRDGKKFDFWQGTQHLGTSHEGVFNRQIANRLRELCQKEGIEVVCVYHDNFDRLNSERILKTNQVVEKNPNADVLFLSIHNNASSNLAFGAGGMGRGMEIYTTKGTTKADKFASLLFENVKAQFGDKILYRPDYTDGDADKEINFDVLYFTACPAVLIECLFFDNWQDYQLLLKEETIFGFAEAMLKSIKEYFALVV